jgi:hypothetical protein
MKLIKSKPRYRCDFCKHTSMEAAMKRHEVICFRNPDRYCELCGNKGEYTEVYDEGLSQTIPCYYYSKFDPTKLEDTK